MAGRPIVALVALCALAGCGRLSFDAAPAADARARDVPDACAATMWGEPTSRPFEQINTLATEWSAEMSDDGLRLVYASDRLGGQHMYFAQRASRTLPFDPAIALAINDDASYDRDPSFNDQELYFVSGRISDECIYGAPRVATPQIWGTPRRLDALCPTGEIGGPYISRDGNRLYYDIVVSGVTMLMMASRPDGAHDFITPAVRVEGVLPGMRYCALTNDELTVYCETSVAGVGETQLWQATRTSIDAAFRNAGPVPGLDTTGQAVGDPSVRPDGSSLLYAITRASPDLVVVERVCQ